ncbi:MAG: YigZ family protein [Myxococcota bacterium]|nr:YigZ family protein [Myxococcota bacterium]
MPLLRRPASRVRVALDPIKGSRFLATLDRALDAEQAMALIQELREEMPDATHHCFAWRIDPEQRRSSDDGEPNGTAGLPILRRLDSAEAEQTVVIVTRYYGGTKLGCGGLVRAYGEAAALALEQVQWVEEAATLPLTLRCTYSLEGPVRGLITRFAGEVTDAQWDHAVQLRLAVPVEAVSGLKEELQELGAGSIEITDG